MGASSSPSPALAQAVGRGAEAPDGTRGGLVLQIQRLSTEDGPGIRTTAFLKGCPLSCLWCHNPESLSPRPEVQWIGLRCIAGSAADGCGACLAACRRGRGAAARGPESVPLSRRPDGAVQIDRRTCDGCGACAAACPSGAMELLGTRYTASSLAAELLKDRAFFRRSDRGGVTLSGGEASAQGPFARETLRLLSEAGVHTALDTCGLASWEVLASLYPHVDLLLWDLKEIDPVLHERYTGLDNRLILANLEKTADWMRCHEKPRSLWIRTPIIPCATDREENLLGLGRAIARIAPPRLERWELCAFNNLCADKYLRLGKAWPYAARPLMAESDMERLTAAAQRGLGGHPLQATWTGSTRLETAREEA